MNWRLVLTIILFLFLIGGATIIYFKYEKPIKESNDIFYNVSIYATYEGRNVVTGYSFSGFNGETLENGAILENLRGNNEVTFSNFNLEGQNFYTYQKKAILSKDIMTRVELILDKPKEVKTRRIDDNTLEIESEMFKNVKYCMRWSKHYIFVGIYNLKEISKPEMYRFWDRCYDGNVSLINSKTSIVFSSAEYGVKDDEDYIELAIIDSDIIDGKVVISKGDEDLYGKNKIIKIK